MMRTTARALALAFMLLAVCLFCAAPARAGQGEETTIYIASDLHYLSPRLVTPGAAYEEVMNVRDGKEVRYIEQLVDAFVDQVRADRPDMLLLCGDLTFNGELFSHEDLAKKLERIDPAVTKVYVVPGNHDINNVFASAFVGDAQAAADYVSPARFAQIYDRLGLARADYTGTGTLFYSVRPASGPWLAMLDSCRYVANVALGAPDSNGAIGNDAIQWLPRVAEKARAAGQPLITVSHHNLFMHNRALVSAMPIRNNDELYEALQASGVRLHLSGHIHAQNIAEHGGIYDIASNALSVYPHRYGVLRYVGDTFDYHTEGLDVAAWARARGSADPNLLDYGAYTRAFFDATVSDFARRMPAGLYTPQGQEAVLAMARDANARYFAGEALPRAQVEAQAGYALLMAHQATDWLGEYVQSIAFDDG
ncbi:MAG: metallophosphoesterase, partial [Oscillospiraceae bacterium]|nr:metallophosphoesterase [Oscillospiraceae bacterium]